MRSINSLYQLAVIVIGSMMVFHVLVPTKAYGMTQTEAPPGKNRYSSFIF